MSKISSNTSCNFRFIGCDGYVHKIKILTNNTFSVVWTTNLKKTGYYTVSLQVDKDRVFATSNGYVFCLNAIDGEIVWQNSLSNYGNASAPLLLGTTTKSAHLLYIGLRGYVIALSKGNGQLRFSRNLKGTGWCTVSLHFYQDMLIAGTAGQVFFLDPIHGDDIFPQSKIASTWDVNTPIFYSDEERSALFVGCNGYIMCFDMVGAPGLSWKTSLSGCGHHLTNIVLFQVGKRCVLFSGTYGYIFAHDAKNGVQLWKNSLSGCRYGVVTLCIAQRPTNRLLFGTNGFCGEIDMGTGKVIGSIQNIKGSLYHPVTIEQICENNQTILGVWGVLNIVDSNNNGVIRYQRNNTLPKAKWQSFVSFSSLETTSEKQTRDQIVLCHLEEKYRRED
mmetsp:Transcript_14904/g.22318  ORF Transcript_14904/g.22318 Transcript_14904/m.22318 type:complete len:390 (+) Transcript_14904:52-1221(+)